MPFSDCDSMCDVVYQRRERPFRLENDAIRHVIGIETLVVPQNADYRNINVREDIRGCIQNNDGTQNQQQKSCDHERVRPPQR